MGRSMFFRARLPRSSKVAFNRPATASWTVREIRMPPGSLCLKASSNVDTIAIQVVAVYDQIAQVQAHAEYKRSIGRLVSVDLGHGLLDLNGSTQRIPCARELDHGTLGGPGDPPSRRC